MTFLIGILTRLGLSWRLASILSYVLIIAGGFAAIWYFESSIESHYRNKFQVQITEQLRDEYKDLLMKERESAKKRERALLEAQNRYTHAIESLKDYREQRDANDCGTQISPLAGSVLNSLRQ